MSDFTFDTEHLVVVCRACEKCVSPTQSGVQRHLGGPPHNLRGETKKATAELLLTGYGQLRSLEELEEEAERLNRVRAQTGQLGRAVKGLRRYADGLYCLRPHCVFCTRNLVNMKAHLRTEHGLKAKEQKAMRSRLWGECVLQTYFSGDRTRYFAVAMAEDAALQEGDDGKPDARPTAAAAIAARLGVGAAAAAAAEASTRTAEDEERERGERELFARIAQDVQEIAGDWREAASTVQGFTSKTERVPWLERTGFVTHLVGLKDEEIYSSYQLPANDQAADDATTDTTLVRILNVAEGLLRDAYKRCDPSSKDQKMTQQRAIILNSFYASGSGGSGRSDGFRSYKNPSTLNKYFKTFKQLLVYFYNVTYATGDRGGHSHFTRTQEDQCLPHEVVEYTRLQREAMDNLIAMLGDRGRLGATGVDGAPPPGGRG